MPSATCRACWPPSKERRDAHRGHRRGRRHRAVGRGGPGRPRARRWWPWTGPRPGARSPGPAARSPPAGAAPTTYTRGPEAPTTGVTWHLGDARDEALLERAVAGADALIHLAAHPHAAPGHRRTRCSATNTQATFIALEAAGVAGVGRVVIASTHLAPGAAVLAGAALAARTPPSTMRHPNIGTDPYALSKEVDEADAGHDAPPPRLPGGRAAHQRRGAHGVLRGAAAAHRGGPRARSPTSCGRTWTSRDAARAFALSVERDIPGLHVINVMAPDTDVKTLPPRS